MTLKTKVPFYDGLLPDEGPFYEFEEKLSRPPWKFFTWLQKTLLNMLGKPKNYRKIRNLDYDNTNSSSSVKPHVRRQLSRKIRVTLH